MLVEGPGRGEDGGEVLAFLGAGGRSLGGGLGRFSGRAAGVTDFVRGVFLPSYARERLGSYLPVGKQFFLN